MTCENMHEIMGWSDHFVLCDKLFIEIEKQRGSEISPGDGSTTGELTVQYLWGSKGLMDNAGYYSVFCQDVDHEALLASYTRIGLQDVADLMRASFEVFGGSPPGDENAAAAFFGSHEALREYGGQYWERWHARTDGLEECLAPWVINHPQEFRRYRKLLAEYGAVEPSPWWKFW